MAVLVGIGRRDYVSKKTGKPVKGYSVYFTEEERDVVGVSVLSGFISDEEMEKVCSRHGCSYEDLIGSGVRVYYNRFGNIDSFELE